MRRQGNRVRGGGKLLNKPMCQRRWRLLQDIKRLKTEGNIKEFEGILRKIRELAARPVIKTPVYFIAGFYRACVLMPWTKKMLARCQKLFDELKRGKPQ